MVLLDGNDFADDRFLVIIIKVQGNKAADFQCCQKIIHHLDWCFSLPWVPVPSSVYLKYFKSKSQSQEHL